MRAFLTLLTVTLAAAVAHGDENLSIQNLNAIKGATVMVTTTGGAPTGETATMTGSGFVMRVDGKTGYIVTNKHVVTLPAKFAGGATDSRITFREGTRNERTFPVDVVALSVEDDLAVLRVTDVPDLPAPIDIRDQPELIETMTVYVFGFPFGKGLAVGMGRPSVVVEKGSIASVRLDNDDKPEAILIDGGLSPGNSGGPVVDSSGRLVGIAVATVKESNIGIAIAAPKLLAMLTGRPEPPRIDLDNVGTNRVSLAVSVPLLDPFGKVKAMSFLYGPGSAVARQNNADGSWGPLPGALTTGLKLASQKGQGTLAIPISAGQDLDMSYQLAYVDALNQTVHTRPARYLVVADRSAPSPDGAIQLTPWGSLDDPDGDCTVRIDGGGVAMSLPGTLHDLNTSVAKLNAPRLLQDVDGDFVAQVKVTGDFLPLGPATRDNTVPYNGAGFLVWSDATRFLRFERASVRRGEQVGGFLLMEHFEPGPIVTNNNRTVDAGNLFLKIVRKGTRITGYASADGLQWAETKPMDVDWPAHLKVGLDAITSSTSPFSVRFDSFTIQD